MAQAGPVGEQAGGPLEHFRVLDRVTPAGALARGEAHLAVAFQCLAGPQDGAGAEAEGPGEVDQRGQLEQGAAGQTEIAGPFVVAVMTGDGGDTQEVVEDLPVVAEAELVIDGQRFAGLQGEGRGQTGGGGQSSFHSDIMN